MIRVKDICWLAGLLEGEGCFSYNKSIQLRLLMADKDVVERAASLLHSVVRECQKKPNRKQVYYTGLCSKEAAEWMMTLYPLMGVRRKQKIEELIFLWKNQRIKNKNGQGRRNPRNKKEIEENENIATRYRNRA